jgi:hypothetical protein
MAATFKTNPISLDELLRQCERGEIQLPDFQRSWVWDDERIRGLIASISQAFPVGALMTLESGGIVDFKPRAVEGVPKTAESVKPSSLLLDGQQRMTSLYQTTVRKAVVATITARRQKVRRWYYFDMKAALEPNTEREVAILGLPEDKKVRSNFGKNVDLDLSTSEREYEQMMFPVNQVFDWDAWQDGFGDYWINKGDTDKREFFKTFKNEVLQNFKQYHVPVITLDKMTSKEAVCLIFEKVNTGGMALDAFELVTAMYAADGFELRKDWFARQERLKKFKVLENAASTEFLQVISLLHTWTHRQEAEKQGKQGRDLPAVSATRPSLLRLPLEAYKAYANRVEEGYVRAAKFLHGLRIYRAYDLPYQTQLVPLVAVLAHLEDKWDHDVPRNKIAEWYWCGVFGELYGSAVESRFARDMMELPAWAMGGAEPSSVTEATIRADRLRTMRTRLSAAYKGVNALLMKTGAKDFRSGQDFDHTVFFNENVDIHHIFPRDWCKKQKLPPATYDSVINKTPLSARTNRILGGSAPSSYLAKLESGSKDAPPINPTNLDSYLKSHLIDVPAIRADNFTAFFSARQEALLRLLEDATGRKAYRGDVTDEPQEDVVDDSDSADDQTDNLVAAE